MAREHHPEFAGDMLDDLRLHEKAEGAEIKNRTPDGRSERESSQAPSGGDNSPRNFTRAKLSPRTSNFLPDEPAVGRRVGPAGQQNPRAGHALTHVWTYGAKAPVNAKTHVLRALRRSLPAA